MRPPILLPFDEEVVQSHLLGLRVVVGFRHLASWTTKHFLGKEWLRKQATDSLLPIRYERYKEDRQRRLRELQEQACAEARAAFVGRHDGGQDQQRYLEAQWRAERKVIADFEASEPERTITQYREWEEQNR